MKSGQRDLFSFEIKEYIPIKMYTKLVQPDLVKQPQEWQPGASCVVELRRKLEAGLCLGVESAAWVQ